MMYNFDNWHVDVTRISLISSPPRLLHLSAKSILNLKPHKTISCSTDATCWQELLYLYQIMLHTLASTVTSLLTIFGLSPCNDRQSATSTSHLQRCPGTNLSFFIAPPPFKNDFLHFIYPVHISLDLLELHQHCLGKE